MSAFAASMVGTAFIPYYNQLMLILETNEEMKKTAKGIFKQVCFAAGGTAVGGLVGGPIGALVGGVAGSMAGYMVTDEYQSMISILKKLSDNDKQVLVCRVQALVGSVAIEDLITYVTSLANRHLLLDLLQNAAKEFTKGG